MGMGDPPLSLTGADVRPFDISLMVGIPLLIKWSQLLESRSDLNAVDAISLLESEDVPVTEQVYDKIDLAIGCEGEQYEQLEQLDSTLIIHTEFDTLSQEVNQTAQVRGIYSLNDGDDSSSNDAGLLPCSTSGSTKDEKNEADQEAGPEGSCSWQDFENKLKKLAENIKKKEEKKEKKKNKTSAAYKISPAISIIRSGTVGTKQHPDDSGLSDAFNALIKKASKKKVMSGVQGMCFSFKTKKGHYVIKVPNDDASETDSSEARSEDAPLEEINAIRELKHRHIIPFISAFRVPLEGRGEQWIQVLAYGGKDLAKHMNKTRSRTLVRSHRTSIFIQALLAIQYMHELGWLHGDIKPENLVLFFSGRGEARRVHVRMIDFGSSFTIQAANDEGLHGFGTLEFMAPEIRVNSKETMCISCASDIYALGLLLFYMTEWLFLPEGISDELRNECWQTVTDEALTESLSKNPRIQCNTVESLLDKCPIEFSHQCILAMMRNHPELLSKFINQNRAVREVFPQLSEGGPSLQQAESNTCSELIALILVIQMARKDPSKRPSIEDVLRYLKPPS
ncbi:hypothetical protein ACH42_00280 [Endozoicomonas sp. (ex Bugula neritina AB1)]|nr:hypothetical protein ACH42_00280 [Endozoicomonas sp. (ex Bugula neritina AB1)]